ncbi:hypothetical protein K505DRAFT_366557 [Melanomma pulvis-pyrius CBS 109.77]|uniref:F-box domain-containing protein n=1 Tax=Melanomma pulvis-pyrius CBS 109.77 TaxID=1314802 RepID=A0A6A6WW85_9PLEO|nr:hypothetical protein K505DRAFT_366557 [Melanomma pulvis-pyrius CBS 109.77]
MSSLDIQTVSRAAIPEEIKLQIIAEYLKFPNGLHCDRWPIIKKLRFDPLLSISDFRYLATEALYKNNLVIIKPSITSNTGITIGYPSLAVSHWVRELEFRPSLLECRDDRYDSYPDKEERLSLFELQIRWLQKLASGELGYQRLDLLRLVFDCPFVTGNIYNYLCNFVQVIRVAGPLRIRARRLEIVVGKHLCSENCDISTDACLWSKALSELISIHQDAL